MATTTPDPEQLPARDPAPHFRGVLADGAGDDESAWDKYRARADAVAADQAAPRMVTGYCPWCAADEARTGDGYHYRLKSDGLGADILGPCTGEHAPGLQARPTQYCFWCSIGSPTDERGQHHVDGDVHQCTGQQVPQAKSAEAGDEVASDEIIEAANRIYRDSLWSIVYAREDLQNNEEHLIRMSYSDERKFIPTWPGTNIIEAAISDAVSKVATERDAARAELAQAHREAERLREALENIKNFDAFSSMQNWPDCMAIVQDIAIAALALEVK